MSDANIKIPLTKQGTKATMTEADILAERKRREAENELAKAGTFAPAPTNTYASPNTDKLVKNDTKIAPLQSTVVRDEVAKAKTAEQRGDQRLGLEKIAADTDKVISGDSPTVAAVEGFDTSTTGTGSEKWLDEGKKMATPTVEKPKVNDTKTTPKQPEPTKGENKPFDLGAMLGNILGDLGGIMSQRNHNFAGTPEAGAIVMQNRFNQQKQIQANELENQRKMQAAQIALSKEMPWITNQAELGQYMGQKNFNLGYDPNYFRTMMPLWLQQYQGMIGGGLGGDGMLGVTDPKVRARNIIPSAIYGTIAGNPAELTADQKIAVDRANKVLDKSTNKLGK